MSSVLSFYSIDLYYFCAMFKMSYFDVFKYNGNLVYK